MYLKGCLPGHILSLKFLAKIGWPQYHKFFFCAIYRVLVVASKIYNFGCRPILLGLILITLQNFYTSTHRIYHHMLCHSVAGAFFQQIGFYDTRATLDSIICLAMLGFIWSKAVSLPVYNSVCFLSPVKEARKIFADRFCNYIPRSLRI